MVVTGAVGAEAGEAEDPGGDYEGEDRPAGQDGQGHRGQEAAGELLREGAHRQGYIREGTAEKEMIGRHFSTCDLYIFNS